MFKTKITT